MQLRKSDLEVSNNKARVVLSCLITIAVITGSFVLFPVLFPTNDDFLIQQILSGSISGEPTDRVVFVNYTLSWIVARFFEFLPGVPWWSIFNISILATSLFVLLVSLFEIMDYTVSKKSTMGRLMAVTILSLGVFSPVIGRLQFTTTSAIVSGVACFMLAGIAVLETIPEPRGFLMSRWGRSTGVVLMLAGYSFRPSCGRVALLLCVTFLAVCSAEAMIRRKLFPRLAWKQCVISIVGIIILFSINSLAYTGEEWKDSLDYSSEYSYYCDYPTTPYGENRDLYDSVDWDEDLYNISSGYWFSLDARMTIDSLKAINEVNDWALKGLIADPVSALNERLSELGKPVAIAYLALLCLLATNLSSLEKNRKWKISTYAISILAFVMLGYLLLRGRLPLRAILSIVFPSLGILGAMACSRNRGLCPEGSTNDEAYSGSFKSRLFNLAFHAIPILLCFLLSVMAGEIVSVFISFVALVAMIASHYWSNVASRNSIRACLATQKAYALVIESALLLVFASVYQFGWMSEDYKEQASRQPNIDAFQEYARENPETLFIYDYWAELTPQTVWDIDWPPNATQWGGWTYIMPWFDDVMREQGFGGVPTTDTLLGENALFVNKDDYTRDLLIKDMRNLYGPGLEVDQVDAIGDGLRVYRFYTS